MWNKSLKRNLVMKNLSKILFKNLIPLFCLLSLPCPSDAKKEQKTQEVNLNERISQLDEMDFIQLLSSVDVSEYSDLIQKFQTKEGKTRLLNGKYNPDGECSVEAYRNKEVLLVTIPAHLLFGPNKTELRGSAETYLQPLKRYLKDPDMYRVILVMHTDNTGSPQYREDITVERVNSVFDWFSENCPDTRYLFSYALADDMPLIPNNSMENRDKNRRLEVYLVPGEKMLEQAKTGRIAF